MAPERPGFLASLDALGENGLTLFAPIGNGGREGLLLLAAEKTARCFRCRSGNRRGGGFRQLAAGFVQPLLIGALLMHFMLETMIAGHMMGIDTFDQPAVEEGKILARNYLADGKG